MFTNEEIEKLRSNKVIDPWVPGNKELFQKLYELIQNENVDSISLDGSIYVLSYTEAVGS